MFVIGLKSGDDTIPDFVDDEDLIDLSALFAASGLDAGEVFRDHDRLDRTDAHVSRSKGGLEIDLGQLFGTVWGAPDTLVIRAVSNLSGDDVITGT